MLKQQQRVRLLGLGCGVLLCASTAVHAATFPTEAMFEAESGVVGEPWESVTYSAADRVSGEKYLTTKTPRPRMDQASGSGELSYTLSVPRTAKYTIWLRVLAANTGTDSLHLAVDDAAYTVEGPPASALTKWAWFPVVRTLEAGERQLKLKYREAGLQLDCLLVTALGVSDFVPQGFGVYPIPAVLPPPGHPRLFARDGDLDGIHARLMSKETEIVAHAGTLTTLAVLSEVAGLAPLVGPATTNYNKVLLTTIKAKALHHLLKEKDGPPEQAVRGREAVQLMADYLNAVAFPPGDTLTKERGEVVLTSAIVYDWCYSLMTVQQRSYFVRRFTEIAATMEIGFPPSKQGALVGHGSEMQLMRDQLAAGIAFYDEAPLVYNIVAGRFFADFVAPRNYAYASHAHHQGTSYGQIRYMADMFASWIFRRMGSDPVFDAAQEMTPYQWLYMRRPDGQWMRDGDTYHSAYTKSMQYWSDPLAFLLPATYYANPAFKHEYLLQGSSLIRPEDALWPILFGNTQMAHGVSSPALPLTKYFPDPAGLMIARTGWTDGNNVLENVGAGDVIATMKLGGDLFGNHEHYDAGHFQIYYKGGLAIDSGIYQGRRVSDGESSSYSSLHDMNYLKRTIAHNSMLIYNPQEGAESFFSFANDGGQRMLQYEPASMATLKKVASVLQHQVGPDSQTPDYSYLKGDLKPAYSDKVSDFTRSFVFLNLKEANHPAALIVFDRVRASQASYRKTWLLHSQGMPDIVGDTITIKRDEFDFYNKFRYNGKLVNRTLLPANATLTRVGGEGNEFSVAGINYPKLTQEVFSTEEAGAWRVEVSPPGLSDTDLFLNVMQVMDAGSTVPVLATTAISSDLMAGVKIKDRVVLFAKSGGRLDGPASFELPLPATPVRVLVSDLKAGFWSVSKRGTPPAVEHEVSAAAGTLYFASAEAGLYDLRFASVRTLAAPTPLSTLPTQP